MEKKKKYCSGCESEQYIWKNQNGLKYCKPCSSKLGEKKSINKKSDKQIAIDKSYTWIRKQYMEQHPLCMMNLSPECTKIATDIHHKAGRGINTLNISTFISCCRNCHNFCHLNPKLARSLKLIV
jgi:hypothetical protein